MYNHTLKETNGVNTSGATAEVMSFETGPYWHSRSIQFCAELRGLRHNRVRHRLWNDSLGTGGRPKANFLL